MNRTTSLFLALGLLLAHSLAVHQTDTGGYAGAIDSAHVAFRIARNLFRGGIASWNSDEPSFDAYPSFLWIGVSWIPERLYRDPTRFVQVVGLASALAATVVVSRFSRARLAGILAPFLLVFSGAFASAASSGTEVSTIALLIALGFIAVERGYGRLLAVSLALLVASRPDAALFAVALYLVALGRSLRGDGPSLGRLHALVTPAALVAVGIAVLRHSMTGHWLSPTSEAVLRFDPDRVALGAAYAGDFALKSGSAWLVLFPLVTLPFGKLGGTATRALGLSLVWFAVVVWTGGSSEPFWLAIAPVLPLLFLSVQEGMIAAMDTERGWLAATTWGAFIAALVASGFVSKKPGNLGSLPVAELHFAAMEAAPRVAEAYDRIHGRESARTELRSASRLAAIGGFLHEELNPNYTIVTPWPGSIGYYSRRRVEDLLGRVTVAPGNERLQPWFGRGRTDLVAVLAERPDHLLLSHATFEQLPSPKAMLSSWLERWDVVGDTPERRDALIEHFTHYDLVTIPILQRGGRDASRRLAPFILLRNEGTGLEPVLEIERAGSREFRIAARHRGYAILADLEVIVVARDGQEWALRPTGEWTTDPGVVARPEVLLFHAGTRSIELLTAKLPAELDGVELRAALRNPGAKKELFFSLVGELAVVSFDGSTGR